MVPQCSVCENSPDQSAVMVTSIGSSLVLEGFCDEKRVFENMESPGSTALQEAQIKLEMISNCRDMDVLGTAIQNLHDIVDELINNPTAASHRSFNTSVRICHKLIFTMPG